MSEFNTPSNLGAKAEVVPAGLTPLYTSQGVRIFVPDAEVPSFLAQGFKLTLVDPVSAVRELAAAAQAAIAPVESLKQDLEDGQMHPANFFAAAAAVQNVLNAWAQVAPLFDSAREEGQGVVMTNAEGQTITVDPGQVAEFEQKGWTPA